MQHPSLEDEQALDIVDLIKLLRLLEVAAARGAFKIEEYRDIGETWSNVRSFVKGRVPEETFTALP